MCPPVRFPTNDEHSTAVQLELPPVRGDSCGLVADTEYDTAPTTGAHVTFKTACSGCEFAGDASVTCTALAALAIPAKQSATRRIVAAASTKAFDALLIIGRPEQSTSQVSNQQ